MEDWKLRPARDHGLPAGERLRSLRRESLLMESLVQRAWWRLVRGYLALVHRLDVRGAEQVPREPPFVLVANHTSHLDALVLASVLSWRLRDRVFPIAAGDTFFETPVATAFAAFALNALPLWRKSCGTHALAELRARLLEEPCVYVLFPEGTRSRDGVMATFKPGLGMLVAGTPAAIVPCHLQGTFAALPPDRRWPRPGRIGLRIGAPLRFRETSDDRAGWKEVAHQAEAAVRALAPGQSGVGGIAAKET
jgi:1-acyl-sn-glycerol-3-phosphate acyltransferase